MILRDSSLCELTQIISIKDQIKRLHLNINKWQQLCDWILKAEVIGRGLVASFKELSNSH